MHQRFAIARAVVRGARICQSRRQEAALEELAQQFVHYVAVTARCRGVCIGNEYIHIIGTVPSDFTMKVFGYEAGDATVDYAWGVDPAELN